MDRDYGKNIPFKELSRKVQHSHILAYKWKFTLNLKIGISLALDSLVVEEWITSCEPIHKTGLMTESFSNDSIMGRFCPLASGSRGNSLYLESRECKILIDAGLSGRATCRKLEEIGVSIEEIDAILITHEHLDHIQGLKVLAIRYGIPLFVNREVAAAICRTLSGTPRCKIFFTGETFTFRDLSISSFSVPHDALDPVAFTIHIGGNKLGICTDIGFVTPMIEKKLQGCHLIYIEANHDPQLVLSSPRPDLYKRRVLGRQGHLSNLSCAQLLTQIYRPQMEKIYLSHLSSECNREELVINTVASHLQKEHSLLEDELSSLISLSLQDTVAPIHYLTEPSQSCMPSPLA